MRKLARQANIASEDIRQKIAAIQSSSESTINEIQIVAKVIQEVNEIVGTIAAALEEQAVTTQQIPENVNYMTHGGWGRAELDEGFIETWFTLPFNPQRSDSILRHSTFFG